VLDYGIALKMDKYKLSMNMLLRMIKVFSCISTSNFTYVRSMIVSYQVLLYHNYTKTGVRTMIRDNIACLNEESGECSFATLSRLVTKSATKNDFKYMDSMYGILPVYRQVCQDISEDVKAPLCARGTVSNLDLSSDPVKATISFLRGWIHRARYNQLLVYDLRKHNLKSAEAGQKAMHRQIDVPMLYKNDTTDAIKGHIAFAKRSVSQFWLGDYSNIWPEAVHNKYRPVRKGRVMPATIVDAPELHQGEDEVDDDEESKVDEPAGDGPGDNLDLVSVANDVGSVASQSDDDAHINDHLLSDGGQDDGLTSEDDEGFERGVSGDEPEDGLESVGGESMVSSVISNMERQFEKKALGCHGKRKRVQTSRWSVPKQ
jgi:hypothetical protein